VEYLPQKYLEKICANIEDDEFRAKLNEVIFGYVDKKDRFETNSLEELIKYRTRQIEEDIDFLMNIVHDKNIEVLSVESKLTKEYKKEIEEKLRVIQQEIDAHKQICPEEIKKPEHDLDNEIIKDLDSIDSQISLLEKKISEIKREQTVLSKEVEDIKQAKQTIQRQINAVLYLKQTYSELFKQIGLAYEDIIKLSFDFQKLDQVIKVKENRLAEISEYLFDEDSLDALLLEKDEIDKMTAKSLLYNLNEQIKKKSLKIEGLTKPEQEYQAYLKEREIWESHLKELVGDNNNPTEDTLNWFIQEIKKISKQYLDELRETRKAREEASKEVFAKKLELISFYDTIKESIEKEIKKFTNELAGYNISIEASSHFETHFYDKFFSYINQNVRGSFYGIESGRQILKKECGEVINWQTEEPVFTFLNKIINYLDIDKRNDAQQQEVRDIFKQMKQYKEPVEFYDYLFGFEYLQTKYDLKVDNKDLTELSPGERGGLLLIFYLMLDKRDIPLVIDQPEDNLDNKSVYEILVTFLKKAKKRRQIIMATHNPNLAIVADAEQIIYVSIDKQNNNDFNYVSGSIEDPIINKKAVDILEGTFPAFDNRKLKYRRNIE
ncbi:MAG: TrlF family AAA-like ATPase, partial [Clostridiales bacterium]